MNAPGSASYSEATEQDKPRQLQLAHLSIEVGHFYMEDLLNGEDRIRSQFARVAPWIGAATASAQAELGLTKLRASTCFLIDDYFRSDTSPAKIVDKLVQIATECGITIDYIAREAGCAVADGVPLAETVAAMLLPEPPVGTNGSRPPLQESGWLCNGQRSPDADSSDQAMQIKQWRPPEQFGARNHSIFLDVELWKDATEQVDGALVTRRLWSCPFLAAIWQLLRLGMVRYYGEPVAQPQPWSLDWDWPDHWADLPAVMKINPRAAPFAAFRATSIMPRSYLGIEHAVDVILNHIDLDESVINQVIDRASQEQLVVPRKVTRRISHAFIEGDDESPIDRRGMSNADRR
jgi:hypothetical protein